MKYLPIFSFNRVLHVEYEIVNRWHAGVVFCEVLAATDIIRLVTKHWTNGHRWEEYWGLFLHLLCLAYFALTPLYNSGDQSVQKCCRQSQHHDISCHPHRRHFLYLCNNPKCTVVQVWFRFNLFQSIKYPSH